jgi:hypothetical protein
MGAIASSRVAAAPPVHPVGQVTLHIGTEVEVDASAGSIRLLAAAVR